MSDNNDDTDRVRTSQVLAGALAAVTAALIGSTMGVAGTILGAGLASVISTVGGTVYLRSIKRTTDGVRTVHAKVVGKSGGATVLVSDEDPDAAPGDEVTAETSDQPADEEQDRPPATGRRRWAVLVASTVAAFALGMVVVTGVEWLRGEPLSGGEGTTFSSIVAPKNTGGGSEDRSGDPTTSTTTPTTTTTTPDPTTTSTDPTTTSTTPPSESSTTTTTTTPPPVTTMTDESALGDTIPPEN